MDLISETYLMDCMAGMKEYPDKYFDLAVVDPPYGIGRDGSVRTTSKHGGRKAHKFKGWDNEIPTIEYFTELFRVSKNQIIWGQTTLLNTCLLQWVGFFGIKVKEFATQTVNLLSLHFKKPLEYSS